MQVTTKKIQKENTKVKREPLRKTERPFPVKLSNNLFETHILPLNMTACIERHLCRVNKYFGLMTLVSVLWLL